MEPSPRPADAADASAPEATVAPVVAVAPFSPVDLAVGASALAVGTAVAVGRRVGLVLGPVARVVLSPPVLPPRLQPARWLARVGQHGAEQRISLRSDVSRLLDLLVPMVAQEVLRRADLTTLILRYVDLDGVVATVDLDAAAARLDVDEVVRRADLDSAAGLLDVNAVVRRVDVGAILDRLDLTGVVLDRVDLDVLVRAVIDRIDLVGLAEQVIDAVDLPEIIRESTGSMASDTVRGARMQGIAADEAVGRAVDRLLLRRGRRSTEVPGSVASADQPGQTGVPRQADRTR